jgi:hypothetical protein
MKYQLTWHGPVHDVEYEVIADTEEDAMVTLRLYVQGERVSGVRKIRSKKQKGEKQNNNL